MKYESEASVPTFGPASIPEEIANSITHGLGLLLSLIGTSVLMYSAWIRGDTWRIGGCGIYAGSLVAVYLASTLSHVYQQPRLKRLFRILDQAFIYLLIAGSYTPLALAYLRFEPRWLLTLAAVWMIALAGFLSKIIWAHRVQSVSLWIYLLLGWLPVMSVPPLLELAPAAGLIWMAAGGIFYTVGTVFLFLDERVPYFHATWHVLVILGSTCHWIATWGYFVAAT
jgi:hemolysin III